MKNIIVAIFTAVLLAVFLTSALEAADGIAAENNENIAEKNENVAEKEASLRAYIIALLPFIILIIFLSYRDYQYKVPQKFIFVDRAELVISFFLTYVLMCVLCFLLGVEEVSIILFIWGILVFILILQFFYTYVNLPWFGCKRTSQLWADREKKEDEEK